MQLAAIWYLLLCIYKKFSSFFCGGGGFTLAASDNLHYQVGIMEMRLLCTRKRGCMHE